MVRHHPPGVRHIIRKPAHLRPAAVIHRPQFTGFRYTCTAPVAPAAQSAVHPGMPGRVSATPPAGKTDTVIGTDIRYRRAAYRGKPEKRNRTGVRQGKIRKTVRCLRKASRPLRLRGQRQTENDGPHRPSRPITAPARSPSAARWKASVRPKPSATPVSTRYAAAPAAGSTSTARHPLWPAEYPPRPLKRCCRQVHMRAQAISSGRHRRQSALSGCELCCAATIAPRQPE